MLSDKVESGEGGKDECPLRLQKVVFYLKKLQQLLLNIIDPPNKKFN